MSEWLTDTLRRHEDRTFLPLAADISDDLEHLQCLLRASTKSNAHVQINLLHVCADGIARTRELKPNEDSLIWRRLFGKALTAGADPHLEKFCLSNANTSPWSTPLAIYIDMIVTSNGNWKVSEGRQILGGTREVAKAFPSWAHLLQRCGVDLTHYAARERQILLENKRRWLGSGLPENAHPQGWIFCIEDFIFGPNPSDWEFTYIDFIPEILVDLWPLSEESVSVEELLVDIVAYNRSMDGNTGSGVECRELPGSWEGTRPRREVRLSELLEVISQLWKNLATDLPAIFQDKNSLEALFRASLAGYDIIERIESMDEYLWLDALTSKAELQIKARRLDLDSHAMKPYEFVVRLLAIRREVEDAFESHAFESVSEESENKAPDTCAIWIKGPGIYNIKKICKSLQRWDAQTYGQATKHISACIPEVFYDAYALGTFETGCYFEESWVKWKFNHHFERD